MSVFRRLFGLSSPGGERADAPAAAAKQIEYKGFLVRATPYKAEGGQYQTCGIVSKEIGGVVKEHRFIRADRFAALDDAVDISLKKGQQLVDEQGERMFN
jgi:hypothetical protein